MHGCLGYIGGVILPSLLDILGTTVFMISSLTSIIEVSFLIYKHAMLMAQILQILPGQKRIGPSTRRSEQARAAKGFVGNAMLTSPPLRNTPLKTKQTFGCEMG